MSEFTLDGAPVPYAPGQSVAAALWAAGIRSWRLTRAPGTARGLYCGIGACYDCLATVDGVTGQRLCLTRARPGLAVTTTAAGHARTPSHPPGARTAPSLARDVVVVGAGPAGLAAAATAALAGARVTLLDAAPRAGGQFWRQPEGDAPRGRVFTGLLSIVEERVDHAPGATVWFAAPETGATLLHTSAGVYRAARVILATGAHDRAFPFPGWDLPGVVTPGAAQALLKGSGVTLGRSVVVAGAGPFLLPVAVGLAEAGARVVGVFEAGDPRTYLSTRRGAVPALRGLLGAASRLPEAAGYLGRLARRRIPYRVRHAVLAAHPGAGGRVSGVDVGALDRTGAVVPGSVRHLPCDAVAVGYGFTANLELALALGCATLIGADGGLAVVVDGDGQTTVPGVYAAGEVTGVGGSELAVVEGQLAGDAAARAGGEEGAMSVRDRTAAANRRDRLRAFAELMHAAHRAPEDWPRWLAPSTVVCRCEQVPAAAIDAAVRELGATDGRGVKLFARPGMGWCQGRICGPATAALTARACGRTVTIDDLLAFAHRPFATPVRLADLAGFTDLADSS
jgi:NADPH-dependent 2,4-dienoyl-CoA reductase/sulfur reductase-like enzyme